MSARPDDEQLRAVLEGFQRLIKSYLFNVHKLPSFLKYDVSQLDLIEMVIRVHKRKFHYEHAHGMEINEAKRMGLYLYWFLKFKPIRILDPVYKTRRGLIDINEGFVLCLLFSVMLYFGRTTSFDKGSKEKNDRFWNMLLYSFRYRTLSSTAMMVLVEALW